MHTRTNGLCHSSSLSRPDGMGTQRKEAHILVTHGRVAVVGAIPLLPLHRMYCDADEGDERKERMDGLNRNAG